MIKAKKISEYLDWGGTEDNIKVGNVLKNIYLRASDNHQQDWSTVLGRCIGFLRPRDPFKKELVNARSDNARWDIEVTKIWKNRGVLNFEFKLLKNVG